MSYDFSKIATETSKVTYEGIKVNAKHNTSFGGLRKSAQNVRKAILSKKADVDGVVKEILATYSSAVANPKIKDLRDNFNADVASKRETLSQALTAIVESKKKAIERYTIVPPSDEMLRLVNAFSFRDGDTISNTEWNYLISAVGNNYLALRMVQKLASKFNKSFVMPFNPDDTLKELDTLTDIVSVAINSVDVPDNEIGNSNTLRFYNMDGENGNIYDPYIGGMIEELDSSAGSTVPEEYRSIMTKLKEAQQKAFDNDNLTVSAKINNFIEKYSDQLQTPEEMKEFVYQKAEELIAQANATVDAV